MDNNITSEYSLSEDDLIPLYFRDLVNKKFIPFRAFLTDVSESSDANWSEELDILEGQMGSNIFRIYTNIIGWI